MWSVWLLGKTRAKQHQSTFITKQPFYIVGNTYHWRANCRIQLRRKVFNINVPLVNNTLKLYIEYSFICYYKASNLTLMYLLTAYSSKQIHRNGIRCIALSVRDASDLLYHHFRLNTKNPLLLLPPAFGNRRRLRVLAAGEGAQPLVAKISRLNEFRS